MLGMYTGKKLQITMIVIRNSHWFCNHCENFTMVVFNIATIIQCYILFAPTLVR